MGPTGVSQIPLWEALHRSDLPEAHRATTSQPLLQHHTTARISLRYLQMYMLWYKKLTYLNYMMMVVRID